MKQTIRLAPDAYIALEKSLGLPVVTKDTTPEQVSYMLGIQYVLYKLREGFVIGS